MGIDVTLEDERGKVLASILDPQNLLPHLLERSVPEEPLLAEIDRYGDTIFNRLQMRRFLSQWRIVVKHSETDEEMKFVEDVKCLAMRCQDSVHLYLKFVGD